MRARLPSLEAQSAPSPPSALRRSASVPAVSDAGRGDDRGAGTARRHSARAARGDSRRVPGREIPGPRRDGRGCARAGHQRRRAHRADGAPKGGEVALSSTAGCVTGGSAQAVAAAAAFRIPRPTSTGAGGQEGRDPRAFPSRWSTGRRR
jgi:hypothetical protein